MPYITDPETKKNLFYNIDIAYDMLQTNRLKRELYKK